MTLDNKKTLPTEMTELTASILGLPSFAKLPLDEPRLPDAACWDTASDRFDELKVPMVTVVEVPSLTFMVSIEPNAMERLSRVAVLAVVMIELRC